MNIKQLKQHLQREEQKEATLLAQLSEVQENIQELKCDIVRSTPTLDITFREYINTEERLKMWIKFYEAYPNNVHIGHMLHFSQSSALHVGRVDIDIRSTPDMLRTLADLLEGE